MEFSSVCLPFPGCNNRGLFDFYFLKSKPDPQVINEWATNSSNWAVVTTVFLWASAKKNWANSSFFSKSVAKSSFILENSKKFSLQV